MKISLRVCLFTDLGPAGWRLEREAPLPIKEFSFPATEEGMADARTAQMLLQEYVTKNHAPKKSKK